MPWAAVAGAAVSVIGGAIVNHKATSEASNAQNTAADAASKQSAIAQDQWDTYKQTYQPLEKQFVADAQTADSPGAYQRAAGAAEATTSEQFAAARDRLSRTPGVDPSSAAYTSAMAGLDRQQAAVGATGQNAARQNVAAVALARKTDALSLGKGLPAQAAAGVTSAANTNMYLANSLNQQANATGAAFGRVVSNGIDLYNKTPATPATPGLTAAALDFANNYTTENYG